jgi:hypothetical protein
VAQVQGLPPRIHCFIRKKKTTKKVTKNDNDQLKSESVRTLLNLLLQHMLPMLTPCVTASVGFADPNNTGETEATSMYSAASASEGVSPTVAKP